MYIVLTKFETKKMKQLIFTLLSIIASKSFSQEIFITDNQSDADYIIYICEDQSQADWVVMKTDWRNDAKDGKWFFTEWKNDADLTVYITKDKSKADKIVYYTEWTTDIKFKLDD